MGATDSCSFLIILDACSTSLQTGKNGGKVHLSSLGEKE